MAEMDQRKTRLTGLVQQKSKPTTKDLVKRFLKDTKKVNKAG
jgi:hypothetical protein